MLVTVLFFSVLVLMFVGAAFALAPSGFLRSAHDSALSASTRAARSGLDWARLRLSSDPRWNAETAATFDQGTLHVVEGDGQVTGWLQDNGGWARFRLRFNYQDGPASAAVNSDGLDDPSVDWTDFPYVSCNNLMGPSPRQIPIAESGTNYSSPAAWGNTQLDLPAHCLLLSIEGACGRNVGFAGQYPDRFLGGYQKKVAQTVLRFGSSQPILEAVTMVNGDLDIKVNQPLALNAQPGEKARMRTKQSVSLTGGALSTNGEILYLQGQNVSGPTTGVTVATDGNSDFFKIPANKVKQPSSPISLAAGVYVVSGTTAPQIHYVNMSYADYVAANPRPTGNPFTLPSGMSISGPNAEPAPRFTLAVNRDVQIGQSGGVTDFALVPDGGADQSASYGGGHPSPPPPPPQVVNYATIAAYYFDPVSGSNSAPLTSAPLTDLLNLAQNHLTLLSNNATPPGNADTSVTYKSFLMPGGQPLYVPMSVSVHGPVYLWMEGGGQQAANQEFTTFLQSQTHSTEFQSLIVSAGADMAATEIQNNNNNNNGGNPTGLKPKDVELQLNGGASGLTLANDGAITIGTQIKGTSSALVSKSDIALIGTSTDLSSSPGTQLGLNLYAQGNITIDAFQLDSSGGQFRSFNLGGILYAWNDVNVLMGDSSGGGTFNLRGGLVAYGGDPSQTSVAAGQGKANLKAASMSLTYDPAYLASLLSSGPFDLDILSWHEF
ncbi:MAG: hypothetical protein KF760_01345 [Candidatus Eremiobacteraeota bacterium]|nr:hypothetical protein [Candidatus Eremiobacteraeota bacterium]MCW5869788.1 hypothetical protein [Candidatus Eremiobacteraeota bacterium]